MKPMRALLIHQNFPGQFRHLAQHLVSQNNVEIKAIGRDTAPGLPGLPLIRYTPHRDGAPGVHPYLRTLEAGILHGQAVAKILLELRDQGWAPDVILAHPGWGESLFVKEVFPRTRLIHYCEYFYRSTGADLGFDPSQPVTLDEQARIRSRNALHLLALETCDAGITPTRWQHSLHPREYYPKIRIAHEGIDTDRLGSDPNASFQLPDGRYLTQQDEVITYVARNLEPYRGFPQFMRALEQFQRQRPNVHALIIGGDGLSYGSRPKDASNWREKLLREVSLDPEHTHFTSKLPYARYVSALQISRAHVYLTYPFVLSWSMLEAMASGCVVVGSDTAPVREVIRHGKNGYLVDFFDTAALAERLTTTLDAWPALDEMRVLARRTVLEQYGVHKGLHAYLQLIKQAAEPFSTDSYIYVPNGKTSSFAEFPMTTIQINGK